MYVKNVFLYFSIEKLFDIFIGIGCLLNGCGMGGMNILIGIGMFRVGFVYCFFGLM